MESKMFPSTNPEELDSRQPIISFLSMLVIFAATLCGAMVAVIVLPALAQLLVGPGVNVNWDLTRASGIVAYVLMWLSVVFGLLITNRMASIWPGGPAAFDLHQFTSLLGLAFALFHAVVLLGDSYIKYSVLQIALPFASVNYQPFWVGLGQIAFYILIPVTLSFYARRSLGPAFWRLIHFGSFISFAFITMHGLLAGSDTTNLGMLGMYIVTGASVFFLTIYRMLSMVLVTA
jgi:predicted ferric reductase